MKAPNKETIELLLPTPTHQAAFAILCAQQVYGGKSEEWDAWASDYLSGVGGTGGASA